MGKTLEELRSEAIKLEAADTPPIINQKIWIACPGLPSENIPFGHTGQIYKYNGRKWDPTGVWSNYTMAEKNNVLITISTWIKSCDTCLPKRQDLGLE